MEKDDNTRKDVAPSFLQALAAYRPPALQKQDTELIK